MSTKINKSEQRGYKLFKGKEDLKFIPPPHHRAPGGYVPISGLYSGFLPLSYTHAHGQSFFPMLVVFHSKYGF